MRHDNKNYFLEVKHELKPVSDNAVWDGVIEKDSSWAYAEQGSFKMALRMMSKNHEEFYQQALELQGIVNEKFSNELLYEGFVKAINGEDIDIDSWLDELEFDMVTSE